MVDTKEKRRVLNEKVIDDAVANVLQRWGSAPRVVCIIDGNRVLGVEDKPHCINRN